MSRSPSVILIGLATPAWLLSGCANIDQDVTYNRYQSSAHRPPITRRIEMPLDRLDHHLDQLDRRFEQSLY